MKQKMIFVIISIFISFPIAQAQGLQAASQELIKILQDSQVKKIGDLDLTQLAAELNTIQWVMTSSALAQGSGKPRFDCNYFVQEKRVICDSNLTDKTILEFLALHEGLGALGYDDENYSITAVIAAYAFSKDKNSLKFLDRHLTNLSRRQQNQEYLIASGGGTHVGGGGDSTAVALKIFSILGLLSYMDLVPPDSPSLKAIEDAIHGIILAHFENSLIDERVRVEKNESEVTVYIPFLPSTRIRYYLNRGTEKFRPFNDLVNPVFEYFLN